MAGGGSTSKYGRATAPLVKFRQIRLVKVWARRGPTLDKPSNSGLSAGPERGVLPPAPTVVVQLYRTTTVHMHIYEVHHVSITSDCAASTSAESATSRFRAVDARLRRRSLGSRAPMPLDERLPVRRWIGSTSDIKPTGSSGRPTKLEARRMNHPRGPEARSALRDRAGLRAPL